MVQGKVTSHQTLKSLSRGGFETILKDLLPSMILIKP